MAFQIRNCKSQQEIQQALQWQGQDGWNLLPYDAKGFLQCDPQGFWMGYIYGQPIAFITAVKFDENYGFVGNYIVKKQFRGKGYGKKIWEKALQRFKNQNLALDAVCAMQSKYSQVGFKTWCKILRWQTKGTADQKKIASNSLSEKYPNITEIPVNKDSIFELAQYDTKIFPSNRELFLSVFLSQPQIQSVQYVQNGKIKGYGAIRPCTKGYMIGPVVADSQQIGEQIISSLRSKKSTEKAVLIDVFEMNKFAMQLVEKENSNFKHIHSLVRMYSKQIPSAETPIDKFYYAILASDFG